MKSLLILIMLCWSTMGWARELGPVEAKLRFHITDEGRPAIGIHWLKTRQIGSINLVLEWEEYSEEVQNGFILSENELTTVQSPQLPENCQVNSLKGILNSKQESLSVLSLTIQGPSCETFLKALYQEKLKIAFSKVPHHQGEGLTKELVFQLTELPE